MEELIKKQNTKFKKDFLTKIFSGDDREQQACNYFLSLLEKFRKETAKYVANKMTGKDRLIDNPECPYAVIGYNERIFEEKELKEQILKELK